MIEDERKILYQMFILLLDEASTHDSVFKKNHKKKNSWEENQEKNSESWVSIDNKSHCIWTWTWISISEDIQWSSLLLESHTLTHLEKQDIQKHAIRCDMKIENNFHENKECKERYFNFFIL